MRLYVDIKKELDNKSIHAKFEVDDASLGIMGASGAGKSVILKCIAGILSPDVGIIKLDDTIFFDSSKNINLPIQERHVGYLFQNYALFDNMTVYQNIEIGLIANKIPNKKVRIQEMITLCHLEGLEERYPYHLSGGQQQRVALARMLAYKPKVLLFDEPFSALDTDLKEELYRGMKNILKDLKQPALLVSHDKKEIELLTDTYMKIEKGECIL